MTILANMSQSQAAEFFAAVSASGLRFRDSYLGPVANGVWLPNSLAASQTKQMSRTGHFARDDISEMYVEWPNFLVMPGTGEVAVGAPATITASVEYPVGTFTRILFSGAVTGTASDNSRFRSDKIAINIPRGAQFYIRTYRVCSAGVLTSAPGAGAIINPENALVFSGGAATDQTMGGVVYSSTNLRAQWFGPSAILGMTRRATYGLVGDSRIHGASDTLVASSRDMGTVGRAIGKDYAYLNMGISSEQLTGFTGSGAHRVAMADYCSHQVLQLGANDLSSGAASVATKFNNAKALLNQLKPIISTTIEPYAVTSTDLFITTANQTVGPTNADRITENNRRRAGIAGVVACWDIADAIEVNAAGALTRDGGLWACLANGVPAASGLATVRPADGTHAVNIGAAFIGDSGVVAPKSFGP
jgi:hypothetical protein